MKTAKIYTIANLMEICKHWFHLRSQTHQFKVYINFKIVIFVFFLEFIALKQEEYISEISTLTETRKKEDLEKILFGIYQNREKSGWTNWDFFSGEFIKGENMAIIQELEEKNIIVQRGGRFQWVKLKNGLIEEIIKENFGSKS